MIEATDFAPTSGVISIRNGVPHDLSAPPGGIPQPPPDTDPTPHHVPTPAEEVEQPGQQDAPVLPNEPPHEPPRREANHRNQHNKHK